MSLDKVKTLDDLAFFVDTRKQDLIKLEPDKHYHVFQIKKPGSEEKRTIESPHGKLKEILDRLADGFQSIYYEYKTDAAYGFVRSYPHHADKRNILTNAKCHVGCRSMLNLDLDSFFYQVDTPKVKSILNSYTYFSFNRQTEELLSKLLTYHGRLPMGSPTSPVLSNFATITLDHELLYWTRQANIVYTRYVDDLTFSSDKPITNDHYGKILSILHSHQFSVDPQKTRWYDETMQKEVTGLIVGEKITIPEDYFTEVEMNIRKLENVFEYAQRFPDWQISEWLEKLKQTIGGQIEFIGRVYGKKHSIYRDFSSKLKKAIRNTDIEESISWRYIGYGDF